MPDPRFFLKSPALSLAEIALIARAEPGPGSDLDYRLEDVAPLDVATADDLSFLDNVKYKDQFLATRAGACFVSPAVADMAPKGLNLLISKHPYKSYALAAQYFYPEPVPESDISPQAHIAADAQIGEGCRVEAGAVVMSGAKIGAQSWIEAGAVIGRNVEIGTQCRIGPAASISHALIGDHTRLYPGVRVGQDGFGFAIDPAGHVKVPQLGRVIIGDHVEIGANSCIDRGAGPDTVIGHGTWIDNLVQIGHNAKIGRGCVIVAQVGIAGSTVLEDFVAMGGQSAVAGHLRIGAGARIGAQSGVMKDIAPGQEYLGTPAVPIRQFMRQVALLGKMVKKNT
jgi:UDP-3-O-[3-hydroxymyristoyl] glucosamine N-acyltransferase